MQKSFVSLCLFVLAIATLTACTKQMQNTEVVSTATSNNAVNPPCRITSMFYNTFNDESDSAIFTYDEWGNPKSITTRIDAGLPARFKYDAKHRVKEIICNAHTGSEGLSVFHRFFYDKQNNIVLDSTYNFVNYKNPASWHLKNVTTYTYDALDRMVTANEIFLGNRPNFYQNIYTFKYNQKGNIARRITVTKTTTNVGTSDTTTQRFVTDYGNYDNNVNLLRTNKIWQFVNRDYSANNAVKATAYNMQGLPTTFPQFSGVLFGQYYDNFGWSFFMYENVFKVEYACE